MVVDEYSRTIFIGGVSRSIGYGTYASIDDVTIALYGRSCKAPSCFTIQYYKYIRAYFKVCGSIRLCSLSCLDYLWNIFQEFGDVCGVNMPGKRSSRKHCRNHSLILSIWAFVFVWNIEDFWYMKHTEALIEIDKSTERRVATVLYRVIRLFLQTVMPTSHTPTTAASEKFSTRVFALTTEDTC